GHMTIIESNYISVREEYPDIDSEVRAILLSHAQNGITISSIKSEYRKLTGNPFPLHDNVTDFLLTIPNVTAECSESGKRIFNLKASLKNGHLLDMVLNQKERTS
uniref:MATERNAL EFFECT PROTEIN OSKAR n=1 Tax=Drosophila melanogaster TaxID=7227 RepID=UPI00066EFF98|nr:Chain A, Maternal Effect Protein Oskar [Drosophila melanogaster]5A48_B Chain B, Maternal Effect Protein Oskar [Drosophila melanogaster]